MAKKETEQTMQWPKKKQDRQCNGQKRTYNAMAKKGHKKTNNVRQNTTHKIKD